MTRAASTSRASACRSWSGSAVMSAPISTGAKRAVMVRKGDAGRGGRGRGRRGDGAVDSFTGVSPVQAAAAAEMRTRAIAYLWVMADVSCGEEAKVAEFDTKTRRRAKTHEGWSAALRAAAQTSMPKTQASHRIS